MDVLRRKTPELARKKLWTDALDYNLIRTIMAQAATMHGIEPSSIRFKGTVQTLEAFQPVIALHAIAVEWQRREYGFGTTISHTKGPATWSDLVSFCGGVGNGVADFADAVMKELEIQGPRIEDEFKRYGSSSRRVRRGMKRRMATRLDVFIEYLSARFLKRVWMLWFFSILLAAATDLVAAIFNLWKREVVFGFVMSCGGVFFCVTLAVLFGAIACRNAFDMLRDSVPLLARFFGICSIIGPLLFCILFLSGAFAALRVCWNYW